jgi:hypothetical protein
LSLASLETPVNEVTTLLNQDEIPIQF